jgi:predicted dehydrogenase
MSNAIHLGIVGCGAVAEVCHLPASQLSRDARIVALADANLARAESLSKRFDIEYWTDDYRQLFGRTEGVVISLPNYLHASVASEFLLQNAPVLVEKPLALTVKEAEKLIEISMGIGTLLQPGYMYRFCKGARLVKHAIDEGWLGPLQSFSLESGYVYSWPVASGFSFSSQQAGGGVLIDTGSHMLDLLLWWLGEIVNVEYRDDSAGGIEADCWLSLTLNSSGGPVRGEVSFSRLRQLSDTVRIVGERFTMEYDLRTPDKVRLCPSFRSETDVFFVAHSDPEKDQPWSAVYAEQLDAFAQAIASKSPPLVSAESVLPTVALIERCYEIRKPMELPWTGDILS